MTGLLCITALTNEHSSKGELKDQCMCVHGNGASIRMCIVQGSKCVRTHEWGHLCVCGGERGNLGKRRRGGVHVSKPEIHSA